MQCDPKRQLLLPHAEVSCDANTSYAIDQPTPHTDNRQAAAEYYKSLLVGVDEHTSLDALAGGELDPDLANTVYGAHRFELDADTSRRIHELR